MYYLIITIMFLTSFFGNTYAKALEYQPQPIIVAFKDGLTSGYIDEPEAVHSKKIVTLYNSLIKAFKTNLISISQRLQNFLLELLTSFAIGSIVFIACKSFFSGEPLTAPLIYRLTIFILLALLLQVDFFHDNILQHLINLFDHIPSLFADTQGVNIIESIINQSLPKTKTPLREWDR